MVGAALGYVRGWDGGYKGVCLEQGWIIRSNRREGGVPGMQGAMRALLTASIFLMRGYKVTSLKGVGRRCWSLREKVWGRE